MGGKPFLNLSGKRFGRLLVLDVTTKGKDWWWMCLCNCGRLKAIKRGSLVRGKTRSCGCLRRENTRAMFFRHGHAIPGNHTVEYEAYQAAKRRCAAPFGSTDYLNWAGRGIEFRFKSFEQFFAEVGPRPSAKYEVYSLDRINNDGHYEPGNVRWATKLQQSRNTRRNKRKESADVG